jgi:hypothetical protein
MDHAESFESLEIPDIDGYQLRNAVNVHGRSQAGIVDLHALDVVRDEKPPPTIVHVAAVRQKLKIPLDHASDTIRLGGAQAEPISIARTSGSVPELAEDLRGKTQSCALSHQRPKRRSNHWAVRIVALAHPQQDIGIEESRGGIRHQS